MASSDKRRVFKNTTIVFVATTIDKAAFFLVSILVSRYLNIDNYGIYTTALGYATFFSYFTNIGIQNTLIRALNLERNKEDIHLGNAILFKLILSIGAYTALCVSLVFTNYNSETIYLTLIFGLVRICTEFLSAYYALYEAFEKFSVSSMVQISSSFSFLAATICVIIAAGNNMDFAVSRLVIVVTMLIIITIISRKRTRMKLSFKNLPPFLKGMSPFVVQSIFINVFDRLNIIILSLIKGTIQSGIFTNANIFISTLALIPVNFEKVLIPYLYKQNFNGDRSKFQFAFDIFSKIMSCIAFYITIILVLFAKEIILIIFGEKYLVSVPILQFLSLVIPFIFNPASQLMTAMDRMKAKNKIQFILLFTNIILNIIFINLFSSFGASYVYVLGYMLTFISFNLYLSKRGHISIKPFLKIFLDLWVIFIGILLIYRYLLTGFNPVVSGIIVTVIYLMSLIIFIINKNDLRISQEIFSIKFPSFFEKLLRN